MHLYSSKPPLLATLMAGEYWLINHVTGATLGEHPYEIGRFMLVTINVDAAGDLFLAVGPNGRAIWHDRLGPDLRDGRGHVRHVSHDVRRRAQQPRHRRR